VRDILERALSWTLAVSGWEACGLGEAVEDVFRDFDAVLVLPRDLETG
jgi:hypothetical protein